MPTALERAGDFSQTYDNNGALFPYIKDPLLSGTCSATSQAGCFNDGGVLGRIPANRLYQTGINLLNLYPLPNINGAGLAYNYELTRPDEKALAQQPAIRIDYQPTQKLRATAKYSGFIQRNQVFNGTLPGFNDAQQQDPVISTLAMTVNYNMSSSTFFEATYGQSQNAFGGCIFGQAATGPVFCTTGIPRNDVSNRDTAGLGGLPMIFPDALQLDTRYYAHEILESMQPPFWVNGQLRITPTSVTWGNRIANPPPNMTYPGFLNINATKDFAASVTRVAGRHTLKAGFYNNHSNKSQNQNSAATFGALNFSNDTSNPIDAQFGFANAVLGGFTSYNQLSRYIEGKYLYNNTEGYIQDNWKVNSRTTLDYGVRFVHMQPQYDSLGQASNFLPEKWTQNQAPVLFAAGCVGDVNPCSGAEPAGAKPPHRPAARRRFGGRDRHARAEYRQSAEWPLPVRRRHHQDDLHLSEPGRHPALRHGLRPERAAEDRAARRWRSLLRSSERQRHLRPGHQSTGGPERHRALRAAAGAQRGAVHRRRSHAQRLPVRRKDALVLAMERRRAAGAAVGDGARRGVYRAAQLEHAAGREHQRRRFRRGVPAAEPGSDAGRQLHARCLGHCRRSDARLPGLRLDHPAHVHALADVPRHQPLVPAPLRQRRGVRVQRQHHALRPPEQQRAPSARRGRIVLLPR